MAKDLEGGRKTTRDGLGVWALQRDRSGGGISSPTGWQRQNGSTAQEMDVGEACGKEPLRVSEIPLSSFLIGRGNNL